MKPYQSVFTSAAIFVGLLLSSAVLSGQDAAIPYPESVVRLTNYRPTGSNVSPALIGTWQTAEYGTLFSDGEFEIQTTLTNVPGSSVGHDGDQSNATMQGAFLVSAASWSLAKNSGYDSLFTAAEVGNRYRIIALPSGGGVAPATKLINISTRGSVTNGKPMIAGFVVQGDGPKTYLIRAIGPGLLQFGVNGFLPNPSLSLRRGQAPVAFNDNWGTGEFSNRAYVEASATSVFAFTLNVGSLDSAIVISLTPGLYTVQVSGEGGSEGEALVEVYEL